MDGKTLKPYITALDVSLAETARKMGMTPQSLDNLLKTKDIKTGIIERLSKIYKKPVGWFFDEETPSTASVNIDHSFAVGSGNITLPDTTRREIDLLEKIIEGKDIEIAYLKDQNRALKNEITKLINIK